MCAQHVYGLMGFKSPVCELVKIMNNEVNKILDYGNCEIVRNRGKEAYVKIASLRTGTFYKVGWVDELAQHNKIHSSIQKIKKEVVQGKFIHLPEETSIISGDGFNLPVRSAVGSVMSQLHYRGVSRDHSNQMKRVRSSCV